MAFMTVDGARIYYHEVGSPSGRPLLLLHAALQTADSMAPVVEMLEPQGFRIVVPDLRGHGRSEHFASALTLDRLARDTEQLTERLGLIRPLILGYSLGGILGIQLALRGQAAALVVLASRIRPAPRGREVFAPDRIARRSPVWASQLAAKHLELDWGELARQVGHMLETWPGFSPGELSGIQVPVLALQGDRDELVPVEHSTELVRQIEGAEFFLVPRAGHQELLYRNDAMERVRQFIISGSW